MIAAGLPVLGRILDGQLRAGGSELELVKSMNSAIGSTHPDAEVQARRRALLAASGALYRSIGRQWAAALLTGRWVRAWKLHEARWDVTEFAVDLARADPDPDADILRVQLLNLTVASRAAAYDAQARSTLNAMSRVAFAGTTPLH